MSAPWLEHLRCERDDLHEVLLAQLASNRSEDAGPARVALVVDDHGGVLVERDRRAVVAAERLLRPNDDRAHDLALLDRALRGRRHYVADDDVADARVAAVMAARHPGGEQLAGAGGVGQLWQGRPLGHLLARPTHAHSQLLVFAKAAA